MPPSQHRSIDYLFFGFYLLQIPTTLLLDTQAVYSEWLFPAWTRSVRNNYLEFYRDPFLADAWKHPWYLSFCLMEHIIQVPFFVWAAKCYYYGAKARPRIIIPAIIYSTQVIMVVLAVCAMALGADFSQSTALAPRNIQERLKLCSVYILFLIIGLINLIDSVMLTWKWKQE